MSRKRMIKPRFWVLMMAALLVVFGCLYMTQGNYMERQAQRIAQLEGERTQALYVNSALQRQIDFTNTDEYVERVAHESLGLLRENETRYVAGGDGL